MGHEEAAFLRAICDQPADDTPRLIYADWLDEHSSEPLPCPGGCSNWNKPGRVPLIPGEWQKCLRCDGVGTIPNPNAERAEFIRDGVAHPTRYHFCEGDRDNGQPCRPEGRCPMCTLARDWGLPSAFLGEGRAYTVARGFVYKVFGSIGRLRQDGPQAAASQPITEMWPNRTIPAVRVNRYTGKPVHLYYYVGGWEEGSPAYFIPTEWLLEIETPHTLPDDPNGYHGWADEKEARRALATFIADWYRTRRGEA